MSYRPCLCLALGVRSVWFSFSRVMLSAHTSLDRWPPRDTHTTAARTQRRTHARTHARRPLPRESCRVACVRECRVKRAPPILSPTATHVRVYTRVLVRPTVQKFITRRRGPPVPHPRTRHGDNANFDGLEGSRAPGISITGRIPLSRIMELESRHSMSQAFRAYPSMDSFFFL